MSTVNKWIKLTCKWIFITLLAIALGFVMAAFVGRYLPERYLADKSKSFNQPVESIWELLNDFENYSKWKPQVRKVELLGRNADGLMKWREYYYQQESVTYEINDLIENEYLEVNIAQSISPVQGTWEFRVSEHNGKGILYVKQYGVISQPYYRFKTQFILGQMFEIDQYILAVDKRLKYLQSLKEL